MVTKLRHRMLEVFGPGYLVKLAKALEINQARLSEYCTGTRRIPAHHLLKLSKALHCSPTDLVGYIELEEVC